MTIGASAHRVQANYLVTGLTYTPSGVRNRPMPTRAAVPRRPFVPRTAQPPYSHLKNSSRAELDQLGLSALKAIEAVGGSTALARETPENANILHGLKVF